MRAIILLLLALLLVAAIPAAAQVTVYPPGIYCPSCYACPYAGYPCPLPPGVYIDPNALYSYDQNYRYGGYYPRGQGFDIPPYTQFPPYLGMDASQQWFAQPR